MSDTQRTKRFRKVWPADMVIHLWANQSQSEASTRSTEFRGGGTCRQAFFEGRMLWSYGHHYLTGVIVPAEDTADGIATVLINDDRNSLTTNGHVSLAWGASRQFRQISVPNLTDIVLRGLLSNSQSNKLREWQRVALEYTHAINEHKVKAAKRRKSNETARDDDLRTAARYHKYATALASMLGREYSDAAMDRLVEEIEENRRKEEERKREANVVALQRMAKGSSLWRQGHSQSHTQTGDYFSGYLWSSYGGPVLLRIRKGPANNSVNRFIPDDKMGDVLETSLGAEVPLAHAIRAFKQILACRTEGKPWVNSGHTISVGHFQINRINADGSFKAGCHDIGWPEVERIARLLGLIGKPVGAEVQA